MMEDPNQPKTAKNELTHQRPPSPNSSRRLTQADSLTTVGRSPYYALEKGEIRIIRLQPSDDRDAIPVCELLTVSLDEKPEFEALSYVWGDPQVVARITLDGRSKPVTVNLHTGLRYLRHQNLVRTIWVDANLHQSG